MFLYSYKIDRKKDIMSNLETVLNIDVAYESVEMIEEAAHHESEVYSTEVQIAQYRERLTALSEEGDVEALRDYKKVARELNRLVNSLVAQEVKIVE